MASCLHDSEIIHFVTEATSAAESARIASHLAECADCRARVESARSLHSTNQLSATHSSSTSLMDHIDTVASRDSGLPPVPPDALLPSIDGYEILSRIHSGAQGVVYKAVQKSTKRIVAVKLLPQEHLASERQKHRFEREVGLAASLRHPNIVTIYDSGLTSGRYYFAMEYIHGKPLDGYIASAKSTIPERMRLFADICAAVSYAHQKGVIHRDLKPGNILVDGNGQPHVVDFGLAKSAGVVAMQGEAQFTRTSQFMGTLAYASPEQTKGDPSLIDIRSDIYSLGVILFEMLTGTYPYTMSTDLVTMFQTICHVSPRAPSSINPEISADVDTITLRALAKEPGRRYQTVAELQQDVERWLTGDPINARRDSVVYMVRMRSRRFVQRRRVLSLISLVVLAAIGVGQFITLTVRKWPGVANLYEQLATAAFSPPHFTGQLEQVRLIAIDDDTPGAIASLAAQEGFSDVSATTWKSLRRLHGRLMQRLARSGARAVVWDIEFVDEQPYNADFIQGVKSLQQAGVNPVIVVSTWNLDRDHPPDMAPDILSQKVAWAATSMAGLDGHTPWRADLYVQRGDLWMVGMGIAALNAMRHPMMDFDVHLDGDDATVQLRYFPSAPTMMQSLAVAATESVKLSSIYKIANPNEDEIAVGLREGDLVGNYIFLLCSDQALAKATVTYQDVMRADDQTLTEWFKDKLVMIGDLRHEGNFDAYWPTPDGRMLAGAQAQLMVVDALLRNAVTIKYPHGGSYVGFMMLCALSGVCLSWLPARRAAARMFIAAGAAVLLFVAFLFVYRWWGYLWFPFAGALAMVVAYGGAVWIDSVRRAELSILKRSYAS